VLDPDVVVRADAGARHPDADLMIRGAAAAARQALTGLTSLLPAVQIHPALVNGAAGVILTRRGRPVTVMGFTVVDGKIAEINAIADPERVRRITASVRIAR
jgi:RNA polymerase sigma-70 factor (ECF subfamily)